MFREQERHPFTYHMVSGLVRLHLTSPDGGVKTLFYHTDGTQFGFQGFKRDGLTKSTAVAVADTELLEIRFSDLLAYCDVHTECYLAYLEYLFSIMSSQTDEIASLSFETGLHRLAGLLRSMALGGNAEIPYSIDELAEMVGRASQHGEQRARPPAGAGAGVGADPPHRGGGRRGLEPLRRRAVRP